MQAKVTWLGQKMKFEGDSRGFKTAMDSKPPFGDDTAASPKELVLQGLCGCTAMDTIALLKKYKQTIDFLEVRVETQTTMTHPAVFTQLDLVYEIKGQDLDLDKVKQAVHLSRTQYCGVIAMLEKNSIVQYQIIVNDQLLDLISN